MVVGTLTPATGCITPPPLLLPLFRLVHELWQGGGGGCGWGVRGGGGGMDMLAHLLPPRLVAVGKCAWCSGPWQQDQWSATLRLPVQSLVGWPTGLQGEPMTAREACTGCPGEFHCGRATLVSAKHHGERGQRAPNLRRAEGGPVLLQPSHQLSVDTWGVHRVHNMPGLTT